VSKGPCLSGRSLAPLGRTDPVGGSEFGAIGRRVGDRTTLAGSLKLDVEYLCIPSTGAVT
jgi:hypothetical protein